MVNFEEGSVDLLYKVFSNLMGGGHIVALQCASACEARIE